ncbi:hypothetical protein D9756_002821 [Leucocoprinus leucothites]|uniref:Ricin B lectin domain-containing protein n=1 Tax=Leucocoprinus leucothites TaxID=201217 RepID=A0A8H5GBF1_9AGAR|nr:hypothetical protein D9756_002821 [Leucoagaricus leucothites]
MKLSAFSFLTIASYVAGQAVLHPLNATTNKCLDVRGNVRANGTPVQIFDCNGSPAQQWIFSFGQTSVRLANSPFCLDAGNNPTSGTPMKIWQCFANLPAQEWILTPDSRIVLANRGLCLDLTSGSFVNSNVVQTWQCDASNLNQVWTVG